MAHQPSSRIAARLIMNLSTLTRCLVAPIRINGRVQRVLLYVRHIVRLNPHTHRTSVRMSPQQVGCPVMTHRRQRVVGHLRMVTVIVKRKGINLVRLLTRMDLIHTHLSTLTPRLSIHRSHISTTRLLSRPHTCLIRLPNGSRNGPSATHQRARRLAIRHTSITRMVRAAVPHRTTTIRATLSRRRYQLTRRLRHVLTPITITRKGRLTNVLVALHDRLSIMNAFTVRHIRNYPTHDNVNILVFTRNHITSTVLRIRLPQRNIGHTARSTLVLGYTVNRPTQRPTAGCNKPRQLRPVNRVPRRVTTANRAIPDRHTIRHGAYVPLPHLIRHGHLLVDPDTHTKRPRHPIRRSRLVGPPLTRGRVPQNVPVGITVRTITIQLRTFRQRHTFMLVANGPIRTELRFTRQQALPSRDTYRRHLSLTLTDRDAHRTQAKQHTKGSIRHNVSRQRRRQFRLHRPVPHFTTRGHHHNRINTIPNIMRHSNTTRGQRRTRNRFRVIRRHTTLRNMALRHRDRIKAQTHPIHFGRATRIHVRRVHDRQDDHQPHNTNASRNVGVTPTHLVSPTSIINGVALRNTTHRMISRRQARTRIRRRFTNRFGHNSLIRRLAIETIQRMRRHYPTSLFFGGHRPQRATQTIINIKPTSDRVRQPRSGTLTVNNRHLNHVNVSYHIRGFPTVLLGLLLRRHQITTRFRRLTRQFNRTFTAILINRYNNNNQTRRNAMGRPFVIPNRVRINSWLTRMQRNRTLRRYFTLDNQVNSRLSLRRNRTRPRQLVSVTQHRLHSQRHTTLTTNNRRVTL